jgi:CHASE3 domain sensor protein
MTVNKRLSQQSEWIPVLLGSLLFSSTIIGSARADEAATQHFDQVSKSLSSDSLDEVADRLKQETKDAALRVKRERERAGDPVDPQDLKTVTSNAISAIDNLVERRAQSDSKSISDRQHLEKIEKYTEKVKQETNKLVANIEADAQSHAERVSLASMFRQWFGNLIKIWWILVLSVVGLFVFLNTRKAKRN